MVTLKRDFKTDMLELYSLCIKKWEENKRVLDLENKKDYFMSCLDAIYVYLEDINCVKTGVTWDEEENCCIVSYTTELEDKSIPATNLTIRVLPDGINVSRNDISISKATGLATLDCFSTVSIRGGNIYANLAGWPSLDAQAIDTSNAAQIHTKVGSLGIESSNDKVNEFYNKLSLEEKMEFIKALHEEKVSSVENFMKQTMQYDSKMI